MRFYDPDTVGRDGYPVEWHKTIKHLVRELADHRCVRCGHPYRNGEHGKGEWSPCDEKCTHDGPFSWSDGVSRYDWDPRRRSEYSDIGPYWREAKWRILTVHHLDMNKWNCSWWNLAALCQRCHLQIQNKVKLAQVYPFEHSDWFKPYAAGFYAFAYRGEELTREETMDRLDELLGLELANL